jgi:eukaryotic-like serine/threonine-protein kinase
VRRVTRWLPWLIWVGILAGTAALVLIATRPAGGHEGGPSRSEPSVLSPVPPGTAVPDLSRMSLGDARSALERAGFWVSTAYAPSGQAPAGRVLGTSPTALSQLGVGAQVTVLVSTGRRRARVPSVQGLSRSGAEQRLLKRGFRVVVVRHESLDPPGAVLRQSPHAGRRVRSHAVVRIVVAARAAPATVPPVVGLEFERAVGVVSAAGFAITFEHRRASRRDDVGRVLAQDPPGERNVLSGARVRLTIGVPR